MKKPILLVLLTSLFVLSSCSKSNKADSEFSSCLNSRIIEGLNSFDVFEYNGKLIQLDNSFNIFDSLKKLEQSFLNHKLLLEKNKEGYSNLIFQISDLNPNLILESIYSENPFFKHIMDGYSGELIMHMHNCRRINYQNFGNKFRSDSYIESTDKIVASGYAEHSVLNQLSENIDYSNEIQRLQLTYLILDNLDYKKDKDNKILFLLNDQPITQSEMEKINPDKIEAVNVIKDKEQVAKYTSEKYDGVIIIKLKKSE